MQVRPKSASGMDGRSYLALLALICALQSAGQVLAQHEYGVTAYEVANQENRAEIRSTAAAESQVEFEPPFTIDCPITSLARINIVHHDSGSVVAQAAPYTLLIPPGLSVFRDAAGTIPISGQTLMTKSTGYDTLWAASSSDITTDHTYVLSILPSTRRMHLTYRVSHSTIHTPISKAQGPPSGPPLHDALGRKYAPKPRSTKPTGSSPANSPAGHGF